MEAQFEEPTNSQWEVVDKILDDLRERQRSHRTVLNATLRGNRTGLQWRELGKIADSCRQSLYYNFRKWRLRSAWEQLLHTLTILENRRLEREETPFVLAVNSQSATKVASVSLDTIKKQCYM